MNGKLVVNNGTANQFVIAADGKAYFGSAADTNLYRASAGVIKTDGVINAVGGLQVNGVAVGAIPPQLGPLTAAVPGNDLNSIVATGWYNGNSPAHSPVTGWVFVQHYQHINAGGYYTQVATTLQADPVQVFTRICNGGTWTAWRTMTYGPHLVARVNSNGTLANSAGGGGVSSSQLSGPTYQVNWTTPVQGAAICIATPSIGNFGPLGCSVQSATSVQITGGQSGSGYYNNFAFDLVVFDSAKVY